MSTDSIPPDERFAVGEIAILAIAVRNPRMIGEEREILALPRPHEWVSPNRLIVDAGAYYVRRPDGSYAQAHPWQLRKRKPPQHDRSINREEERSR